MLDLLAQMTRSERFRAMRTGITNEVPTMPGFATGVVVAVVAASLVGLGAFTYVMLRRRVDARCGPWPLFRAALHVCGISQFDRWLLERMCRWNKMEHPTAVLMSPRLYQQNVQRWVEVGAPRVIRGVALRRLAGVSRALFSEFAGTSRA